MPATITAEEIKEIRGRYGLSQRSFAQLLGIGTASMVRYEQGAQPTRANANLIRAARNPQFMRECLEADGDLIPAKQRKKAESVVYAHITLDSDGNAHFDGMPDAAGLRPTTSMNEVYHYTLQQEILNEKAANLIGQLMRHMIAIEESGGDPGRALEFLLTDLFELKRSILSSESDNDTYLEQIRGHLTYQQSYIVNICTSSRVM